MYIQSRTKICQHCGAKIPSQDTKCSECGFKFYIQEEVEDFRPKNNFNIWLSQLRNNIQNDRYFAYKVGFIVAFIIFKFLWSMPDNHVPEWEKLRANDGLHNYYIDTASYTCNCHNPTAAIFTVKQEPIRKDGSYQLLGFTADYTDHQLYGHQVVYNREGRKVSESSLPTIPINITSMLAFPYIQEAVNRAGGYCSNKCN